MNYNPTIPAPEREVFCSHSDYPVNVVFSFCLYTVPGVPQSVNVTSPSSTSLLVTWDHPPAPNRNGVITGYTVKRQTGSEAITIELPNNDTSLLLMDVMPFTVYNITVAGSTSAGRGEFTTPVTMRTRIDSEWKMGLDNVCVYLSVNAVRA